MKRFVFLIPLVLFFSCATNPGSQTPKDQGQENFVEEKIDPRAPQILDMGFTKSLGSSVSIGSIKSGESAVLFLRVKDKEWDLAKIVVEAEKDGKKSKPMTIELDYQYEEEFTFAQGLDSPDEKGVWTFTATAYDHQGKKSKPHSTDILVN